MTKIVNMNLLDKKIRYVLIALNTIFVYGILFDIFYPLIYPVYNPPFTPVSAAKIPFSVLYVIGTFLIFKQKKIGIYVLLPLNLVYFIYFLFIVLQLLLVAILVHGMAPNSPQPEIFKAIIDLFWEGEYVITVLIVFLTYKLFGAKKYLS